MSYLSHIPPLSEKDNMPGLSPIQLARVADIQDYPDAYDGIATAAITFLPGRGWIEWAATYNTSRFQVRSQDSQEGIIKDQKLPLVIPRHSSAITSMLTKAERDEFIVKVKDRNGQEYIWGSPQKPVRFIFDQNTGSGNDRNQYDCTFYAEAADNLLIYPTTFSGEPIDPSEAQPVVIRRGAVDGPVLAIAPAGSTVVISSPYSFGYELIVS